MKSQIRTTIIIIAPFVAPLNKLIIIAVFASAMPMPPGVKGTSADKYVNGIMNDISKKLILIRFKVIVKARKN